MRSRRSHHASSIWTCWTSFPRTPMKTFCRRTWSGGSPWASSPVDQSRRRRRRRAATSGAPFRSVLSCSPTAILTSCTPSGVMVSVGSPCCDSCYLRVEECPHPGQHRLQLSPCWPSGQTPTLESSACSSPLGCWPSKQPPAKLSLMSLGWAALAIWRLAGKLKMLLRPRMPRRSLFRRVQWLL